MAVTAKGKPQKYSKPRKVCTETNSSLSLSQTSRFFLVLFLFFFFCLLLYKFSRIYPFVLFGPSQGRICFKKRRARVGMSETGWRTSGCSKKHSIVCVSKRVGHGVPRVVIWPSVLPSHVCVSWVGEINYGLIEAASGAFTS